MCIVNRFMLQKVTLGSDTFFRKNQGFFEFTPKRLVFKKNGVQFRILREIPEIYSGSTFYCDDQNNGRKG